jgi:hypothetical protein
MARAQRQSRQDLIEERDALLDALENAQASLDQAQDAITDILDDYASDGSSEDQGVIGPGYGNHHRQG